MPEQNTCGIQSSLNIEKKDPLGICRTYYKSPKTGLCAHRLSPNDPKNDNVGLCAQDTKFLCTLDLANSIPILSYSSSSLWPLCRYKFYLNKIKGVKTKDNMLSVPLKLGIILDKCWQVRYNNMPLSPEYLYSLCDRYELDDFDVAKLQAVIKATYTMGIKFPTGDVPQKEFHYIRPNIHITGFIDLDCGKFFCDDKFSGSPNYYESPYNNYLQFGTYFLSNENYDYGVVKIIRVPGLKQVGQYREESPEEFKDRIHSDILSRPSYYFIGLDKKSMTYGRRFYRSEFDLDAIEYEYNCISRDITRAVREHAFYKNRRACLSPFRCEYLPVCETGVISPDIYDYRKKDFSYSNH